MGKKAAFVKLVNDHRLYGDRAVKIADALGLEAGTYLGGHSEPVLCIDLVFVFAGK